MSLRRHAAEDPRKRQDTLAIGGSTDNFPVVPLNRELTQDKVREGRSDLRVPESRSVNNSLVKRKKHPFGPYIWLNPDLCDSVSTKARSFVKIHTREVVHNLKPTFHRVQAQGGERKRVPV